MGSGVEDAPDGCGGGCGGAVVAGAAELAMGLAWESDTRLLGLGDLRRLYECWMGGRGEGPRRQRRSDAVLAAGVLTWAAAQRKTGERDCHHIY
jgi:hypothetical protein